MLKQLLLCLSLLSLTAFSNTLPKKLVGQYEAIVPAFTFEYQNKELKAAAYQVSVILKSEFMIYRCGQLEFEGTYAKVDETAENVSLGIHIMNGRSVMFDFGIDIDPKTKTMMIKGLKGVPEAQLTPREILLTKKPGRMGRLWHAVCQEALRGD